MAAIKKGKESVASLNDQCNDAIRKGPDVKGIAERQRIPVAGVHGRAHTHASDPESPPPFPPPPRTYTSKSSSDLGRPVLR